MATVTEENIILVYMADCATDTDENSTIYVSPKIINLAMCLRHVLCKISHTYMT